jgi:hypothetical protein
MAVVVCGGRGISTLLALDGLLETATEVEDAMTSNLPSLARAIAEEYTKPRTLGESRPYKSLAEHIEAGLSTALKEQQARGERVFEAVVYAFEGKPVPIDLGDHGMVKRATKYHATREASVLALTTQLQAAQTGTLFLEAEVTRHRERADALSTALTEAKQQLAWNAAEADKNAIAVCREVGAHAKTQTELAALRLHLQTYEKEICLCAALKMADGYIFRGHRHDDCYLTMGGYEKYTKADGHLAIQGFLTSHGRFVTRAEAAELHGIKAPCMSEDLW